LFLKIFPRQCPEQNFVLCFDLKLFFRKFYIARDYYSIMVETINMEKIYGEILALRKDVQIIKNRMVDIDIIMTPEEEIQLTETLELHKKGKTKRLGDLKKEFGD